MCCVCAVCVKRTMQAQKKNKNKNFIYIYIYRVKREGGWLVRVSRFRKPELLREYEEREGLKKITAHQSLGHEGR